MNRQQRGDEYRPHPLWVQGLKLNEQIEQTIGSAPVDWANIKQLAAQLVAVADEAIAAGPVDGLV